MKSPHGSLADATYDDLLDELEGEFEEIIYTLKTYIKDMRLFYENQ